MSKKTWIIFAIIVVGLLAALVVSSRSTNPSADVGTVNQDSVLTASVASGNIADQVFGNKDSKVVLVEYGDLQCPACGSAHPNLKIISEQYKDQIAFVFRNFPLSQIHPNARAGSGAVEAAGLQGKYWEMNNYLYEHQDAWTTLEPTARTDALVSYAKELGLDTDKFKVDIASEGVNQKISFDQALGKKQKVESTPTLFLNGVKVSDEALRDVQQGSGSQLRALIDEQLKKASVTPPTTE